MLTPIDIQNHTLKTAVRGYSKKETDEFLEQILAGYEELFKENHDLKEKVSSLSEGIQNYKQMETTLQKALVLAEKTSAETQEAAKSKADAMIREAQTKAEAIEKEAASQAESLRKETEAYAEITKAKANNELSETRNHVRKLVQSYESYRLQFKKLAESQIEMLESENYSIYAPEIDEMLSDTKADNKEDAVGTDMPYAQETDNVVEHTANEAAKSSDFVEETEHVISKEDLANDNTEETTAQENSGLEDVNATVTTEKESEAKKDNPSDAAFEFLAEEVTEDKDSKKTLNDGSEDVSTDDAEEKTEDTVSDESLSKEDIDAISQKLASGFDKMTETADPAEETDNASVSETKASDEMITTPKLDDFTGDDTIHSVDPEEEEKDSPFTFIEP